MAATSAQPRAVCRPHHRAMPPPRAGGRGCLLPQNPRSRAWPVHMPKGRGRLVLVAVSSGRGGGGDGGGGGGKGKVAFDDGVTWYCYSAIGLIFLADFTPLGAGVLSLGAKAPVALAAVQWAVFVAPSLAFFRGKGVDLPSALKLAPPAPASVAAGAVGGAALWVALFAAVTAAHPGAPPLDTAASASAAVALGVGSGGGAGAPGGLTELLLLGALSPAVAEELCFRGLLLSALRDKLGAVDAVMVAAALFALIHLEPSQFFQEAVLGIFCGGLATASGSIVGPIAAHASYNAAALVFGAGAVEGGAMPWYGALAGVAGTLGAIAAIAWPGDGDECGEGGSGTDAPPPPRGPAPPRAAPARRPTTLRQARPGPGAGWGTGLSRRRTPRAAGAFAAGQGAGGAGEAQVPMEGPRLPGGRVWYFGYGAMLVEEVRRGRGVYPTELLPAACPSRELRFHHMSGFANIPEGAWGARPVHGQLQNITMEEFARVKRKEGGYRVVEVDVEGYCGRRVRALAFESNWDVVLRADVPPPERYILKIKRGAKAAGLDAEYLDWLATIPGLRDGAPRGPEYSDAASSGVAGAVITGAAVALAAAFLLGN